MNKVNAGITIVIVILLVIFISKFSKAIANLFGLKKEPDYGDTPYKGEYDEDDFDEVSIVSRLSDSLHSWVFVPGLNQTRCNVYKDLLKLEDNQFIEVCNTYKNKNKVTLRHDINSTFASGCPWEGDDESIFATSETKVLSRMDDLNVR